MQITKEQFNKLKKISVSCLVTPNYAKYRLASGEYMYHYFITDRREIVVR